MTLPLIGLNYKEMLHKLFPSETKDSPYIYEKLNLMHKIGVAQFVQKHLDAQNKLTWDLIMQDLNIDSLDE